MKKETEVDETKVYRRIKVEITANGWEDGKGGKGNCVAFFFLNQTKNLKNKTNAQQFRSALFHYAKTFFFD
jgi:hypothetical protein